MAESTKKTVSIVMTTTSTGEPNLPTQPLISMPLSDLHGPETREAAVPKSVAKMAKMFDDLPAGPST